MDSIKKTVARDYRDLTELQFLKIHGRVMPNNFYKKNSQSYGPLGKGVMFSYYQLQNDGTENFVGRWMEVTQRTFEDRKGRNGFYSGKGSVTEWGPMFADFGPGRDIKPTDFQDAIAKSHDISQDGFEDYVNPLEDVRDPIFEGDLIFLHKNQNAIAQIDRNTSALIDPYTGRVVSEEAISSSKDAINLFNRIVEYKGWKRNKMFELGLDINNAEHMRDSRVTIGSYNKYNKIDAVILEYIFGDIQDED